jgi:hypothetical protein
MCTFGLESSLVDSENYSANETVVEPTGAGPKIWFHEVPEKWVVKSRHQLDLYEGGGRGVSPALRREGMGRAAKQLV